MDDALDAKRYRWLMSHWVTADVSWRKDTQTIKSITLKVQHEARKGPTRDLDTMIDEAIKAEEAHGAATRG